MSSFVISKIEYIKCAGLVAGLTRNNKFARGDGEIYDRFSLFYVLNAESVQEQYEEEECETDNREYRDEFQKCKNFAMRSRNKALLIKGISHFMRSVLYQVEDMEKSEKIARDFVFYLGSMLESDVMREVELQWWGEVNLDDIEKAEGGDQ